MRISLCVSTQKPCRRPCTGWFHITFLLCGSVKSLPQGKGVMRCAREASEITPRIRQYACTRAHTAHTLPRKRARTCALSPANKHKTRANLQCVPGQGVLRRHDATALIFTHAHASHPFPRKHTCTCTGAQYSLAHANLHVYQDKEYCDEMMLLRYLRARDWSLERAAKMLMKTLQWRNENDLWDIQVCVRSLCGPLGCLCVGVGVGVIC